ncbi:MAG TPA: CBS domain-containing protein [Pseudonocardiaceae bacterium]|jgi:CBS domain-containing protein|nr:CBS domain-containing protein [Pseudonocardiaceae bacterium]
MDSPTSPEPASAGVSSVPNVSVPPAHEEGSDLVHLSTLLKRPVTDRHGESLGRLADVIVRLRGHDYPLVSGLVVAVDSRREVFVSISQVRSFDGDVLALASAQLNLRQFERRDGEVLLRTDVLGHRLIDVAEARLVRATDVELARRDDQWLVSCIDTQRHRRFLGLFGGRSDEHACRDWKAFEPLIGHEHTAVLRGAVARVRGLKPAQIADLLEEASRDEGEEILRHVHQDPELEADVFEELDEDLQSRLLGARTDAEIAAVLARMRADDAADAIAELPQRRREPILELLPAGVRTKVLTLMGFNPTSAGGLMGVDFVTVALDATADAGIQAVRQARGLQAEALTSVYLVGKKGRLKGAVKLATLVQADPDTPLRELADTDPVRVHPDADVVDVALLMADYNLLTLPVVGEDGRPLGVVTVDDVLETTLPEDWWRREPDTSHEPPDPADEDGVDEKDSVDAKDSVGETEPTGPTGPTDSRPANGNGRQTR